MERPTRCSHGVATEIDCAQCDTERERRVLLEWFARCDLNAYPTGALAAAYKALTEHEDIETPSTIDDISRKSTLRDSPAAKRKP